MDFDDVLNGFGFIIIYLFINMLLLSIAFYLFPGELLIGFEFLFFEFLRGLYLLFVVWLNFYFWKGAW